MSKKRILVIITEGKTDEEFYKKIIDEIKNNASTAEDKDSINAVNQELYRVLATRIAKIRNARIKCN